MNELEFDEKTVLMLALQNMQMCLSVDESTVSWINYVFLKFWPDIMSHLDTVMSEHKLKKWLWSLLFWSHWLHYYSCFMFPQQMTDHKFWDEDLKLIIHTAVTEEQKAPRLVPEWALGERESRSELLDLRLRVDELVELLRLDVNGHLGSFVRCGSRPNLTAPRESCAVARV